MTLGPVEIRQCNKCGQFLLAGDNGMPILADMHPLLAADTIPVILHPDRLLVECRTGDDGKAKWLRTVPKVGHLDRTRPYLAEHWCTGRRVRLTETRPLTAPVGPQTARATV